MQYLTNSNTTNNNGWRWISSWARTGNMYISTDFAFSLILHFFTLSKCNTNAMSVRKTRTFLQMVLNTMHLMTFCYSRKDTDWSINSIKTTFSYGLSSSAIKKWGLWKHKVKNCSNIFYVYEWACSGKSKRLLVLENT